MTGQKFVRLADIVTIGGESIDPQKYASEVFHLFSIPAYDANRMPETIHGSDIGSVKRTILPGDCLFSKLNPRINRVWVVPSELGYRQIATPEFWPLRVKPQVDLSPFYLAHLLSWQTFRNEVIGREEAATKSRSRLKPEQLLSKTIPLPPLDEQRRIVRILDEAEGLHQLPSPPPDFTGRKSELAALKTEAESGVTICGLQGAGGVGKTALALVFAEQLISRYPDAQFYLDLKGGSKHPLSVPEALARVIRAYYPTAQLPEKEAELRGIYQSVLHDQRALLLMDNASERWQVDPLLPPSSCFLLVTSRQHFMLPGLRAKNLDTLAPADARNFLLRIAPHITADLADEIARLCGYFPLALRIVGEMASYLVPESVSSA